MFPRWWLIRQRNERLFQADENGLSCYLESSKFTPNVAIYERLGFRLVQEMTLNHDGDTCNVFISNENELTI